MGRESHKTATPLIKARFLTLIVGDRAECCGTVPSAVSQPPGILKANMLWDTYNTNLHLLFDSHHVVLSIHDHLITCDSLERKRVAIIDSLNEQNLTAKQC